MRILTFLNLLALLLMSVAPAQSQTLRIEATAGMGWQEAPRSSFEIDPARSVSLLLGYDLAAGHSLWLGVGYRSAEAFHPRSPGDPSSIRTQVRSIPLQVGYRYTAFHDARLAPFLHTSILIIPTRDEWEADTPAEHESSTGFGAAAEVGVRWQAIQKISIVAKAGYIEAGGFGERHVLAIEQGGPYVEAGLQLSW